MRRLYGSSLRGPRPANGMDMNDFPDTYRKVAANPGTHKHDEHNIASMRGAKYLRSGNLSAFTSSPA